MPHLRTACVALAALATLATAVVHAENEPGANPGADQLPAPRPSTPIALPDILKVAIQQSPELTRAVVDIEAARADALAASGLDDFTLTATGTWSRSRRGYTAGGASFPGVFDADDLTLDVGLVRPLSTGGTLSANASGQRGVETFLPNALPQVDVSHQIVTDVSASLVQPILRGYGKRIARADVRRASVGRDVATLQQAAEALSVVRDVIIAYWQVAYALQVVAIRTDGLNLAVEQLRITERAVRTGSVSPTEGLAAEQAIAVREQTLLLAQVELSQLSLDLRRRVGLEIGKDEIDLAPTTPLQTPTATFDVDAAIARAIQDNPLLALLEAKGKGADIEVEVTDDAIRPRLDFHATVGATGHSIKTSEAFKQLSMIENPSFTISLAYEQQLGARAARGAHDRAKALRRRVRIDLEEVRREVSVSVAHAIDLLRAAQKRIEVSDRAIGLGLRNLEIEQTRFLNGKATNFDVLLRQDELEHVRVGRALAVADGLAAEATVNALTGDLLARHHIRIVPP